MKISEVITILQECKDLNGDLEVCVRDGDEFKPVTIAEGWSDKIVILECNA